MKKALVAIPIALCVIFGIVPILEFIDIFTKTEFSLYSDLGMAIFQTLIAVGATVAFIVLKPRLDALGQTFSVLALPITMINALCFVINGFSYVWIFAVIWCVCIFVIYLKFMPDSNARAACAVAAVLLCFIIGGAMIWSIGAEILGKRTVLRTLESKDGTYIAEIGTKNSIMGKKTLIEVRKADPEARVIIGGYFKKPLAVYEGEEHLAMIAKVSFSEDNDNILTINGTQYEIKFD